MAAYVWWFLIVGLAIGGTIVAALSMDTSRREEDLEADEREAEATLIAAQLSGEGRPVDRATVQEVLRVHRDYRRLPPPDRLEALDEHEAGAMLSPRGATPATGPVASGVDADADGEPHDVGDDRGAPADQHLPEA